jgi:hypothetical protein
METRPPYLPNAPEQDIIAACEIGNEVITYTPSIITSRPFRGSRNGVSRLCSTCMAAALREFELDTDPVSGPFFTTTE